jgi:hypothetical protein
VNPLALMWAERELARLERLDMRKRAKELRDLQDELRPKIRAAQEREWQRKRQDGPTGFVMVRE